jgi:hypothetical protein
MKQVTFHQDDGLIWLMYGPSVWNCSGKPRYQGLLCLAHAPIIVYCAKTQVILFPRLVYLANFCTRLHLASVFLVLVPITSLLGHSTCRITLLVYTRAHAHAHAHTHTHTQNLFACQAWTSCVNARSLGMIRKHWWYIWLVSHLLTVGGALTGVQYMYKCTAPTKWQVSTSDKCLSYTPIWI